LSKQNKSVLNIKYNMVSKQNKINKTNILLKSKSIYFELALAVMCIFLLF